MGEKRNACSLLVEAPERKISIGRPRCRWVDNIKLDLEEIGWGGGVLTGLLWLRIGTRGELL
jgi:hypothetical protein